MMTDAEKIQLRLLLVQEVMGFLPKDAQCTDIIWYSNQLFKYITGESNEPT